MTCVASGTFAPNISWSKGELVLSNDSVRINIYTVELEEGGITFVRSILEICSLETSDSGTYGCTATLPDNSDSGNFTVSVIGQAPELVIVPEDVVNVTNDNSIFLTCVASGLPLPVFTWQRRAGMVVTDIENSTTAVINDTVVEIGGYQFVQSILLLCSKELSVTAEYSCIASNVIGSVNDTVIIRVSSPEGKSVVHCQI